MIAQDGGSQGNKTRGLVSTMVAISAALNPHRRHQVVRQRCVDQLGVVVIDKMVQEHATQPLHDGADRLAVHDGRVDGAAEFFHGDVIQDLDMPGLRVDGAMASMRTLGIGAMGDLVDRGQRAIHARVEYDPQMRHGGHDLLDQLALPGIGDLVAEAGDVAAGAVVMATMTSG